MNSHRTLTSVKRNANLLVSLAVRTKKLRRPKKCNRCGAKSRLVAHHEDYAKPLMVAWLCHKCHRIRHVEISYEHSADVFVGRVKELITKMRQSGYNLTRVENEADRLRAMGLGGTYIARAITRRVRVRFDNMRVDKRQRPVDMLVVERHKDGPRVNASRPLHPPEVIPMSMNKLNTETLAHRIAALIVPAAVLIIIALSGCGHRHINAPSTVDEHTAYHNALDAWDIAHPMGFDEVAFWQSQPTKYDLPRFYAAAMTDCNETCAVVNAERAQ